MASPIEEKFVKDSIVEGSVFEFGCAPGKLAREIASMGHEVLGVDLYDAEIKNCYSFIQCDIVKACESGLLRSRYDNVIAVSSIEHSGIETESFSTGKVDMGYHNRVASCLKKRLNPGGTLIVTVPFGDDKTYFVDKDGNSSNSQDNAVWGFRTFNEKSIVSLFAGLYIIECIAYEKIDGKDYFDINSWREVSLQDSSKYNNENRAVMCCVFQKENSEWDLETE